MFLSTTDQIAFAVLRVTNWSCGLQADFGFNLQSVDGETLFSILPVVAREDGRARICERELLCSRCRPYCSARHLSSRKEKILETVF
jgi:hypothetical protein